VLFAANKNQDMESVFQALSKSQAIIEFQPDGTIITANPNFLNAMGYSLEEVKGQHHSMFVDRDYKNSQEYKIFWENLRAGKFQAEQFKRFGKGGKEVWIEASYNPVLDKSGKVFKVIKFATDITEKTLEFYDMRGRLNAVDRSQATIEFNLDGTIITANENFLKTLGYSLDEVRGKHHSMFVESAYRDSVEYKTWGCTR
jgi:methyl-accepting chemotaxis protein